MRPLLQSWVIPTRLSIGDRDPCEDGLSTQSDSNDTVSHTVNSSRQFLALDRLHRRFNARFRSNITNSGHPNTTSAGIPSSIPSATFQRDPGKALQQPRSNCGRASDHKAYDACCNRGERNAVPAGQEDTPQPRADECLELESRRSSPFHRQSCIDILKCAVLPFNHREASHWGNSRDSRSGLECASTSFASRASASQPQL